MDTFKSKKVNCIQFLTLIQFNYIHTSMFINSCFKTDQYKAHQKVLIETTFHEVNSSSTTTKVDKCLETDPLPLQFTTTLIQSSQIHHPTSHFILNPIETAGNSPAISQVHENTGNVESNIEYLKQKYSTDNDQRMCPMCGKLFSKTTTFNEFQEHVESHFIDDSDTDYNSIERNFELISHAVGDF